MTKVTKTKKRSRSISKKKSPVRRRPLVPAIYFLIVVSSLIAALYLYTEYNTSISRPHNGPTVKPPAKNNTANQPQSVPASHERPRKLQPQPRARPPRPTTLKFYRLEQNFSQAIQLRKSFDQTLTKEQKAQEIIHLLTLSSPQDQAPLPHHTKLLAASFRAPLITIDLSEDIAKGAVNFGGRDEMLAISCLTNSFLANFPEFSALQILIEGEKRETLAGHIDISHPLRYQPSINK